MRSPEEHPPVSFFARAPLKPNAPFLGRGHHPIAPAQATLAAMELAENGDGEGAVALLRYYQGEAATRVLKLFDANRAMRQGQRTQWLANLNAYLAPYKIAPLCARPGKALLDQLTTAPLRPIHGGPKVSILMPVYNTQSTVEAAIGSLLAQTWQNLEILVVDDASQDQTWSILQALSAKDKRLKIRQNSRNLGPYVSKNLALSECRGEWITTHDSDDWAHPQRLENHLGAMLKSQGAILAGTTYMLRLSPEGIFNNAIGASRIHSPDGIRRRAFVSCLFHHQTFHQHLGAWDCVRFGADGEMLARAQRVLGERYQDLDQFAMLCLDRAEGLTNDPVHGLRTATGVSNTRKRYIQSYLNWHKNASRAELRLSFSQRKRPFEVCEALSVSERDIAQLQAACADQARVDANWYRQTYRDVETLEMSPDYHFQTYGRWMGRAPFAEHQ